MGDDRGLRANEKKIKQVDKGIQAIPLPVFNNTKGLN